MIWAHSVAGDWVQFRKEPPAGWSVAGSWNCGVFFASLNLNSDYLSDALAAQVSGIGIAPGANSNYETGHAIFEATHGTAPKYDDLDKVNFDCPETKFGDLWNSP